MKKTILVTLAFISFLAACKKDTVINQINKRWYELGGENTSTFNKQINSIVTDAQGNVYSAGGFKNTKGNCYVAKWDGNMWVELGEFDSANSNNNAYVSCINIDSKGNIYAVVGYLYTTAGYSYFVTKWNGSVWTRLGGNSYSFNTAINDLAIDSSGAIYVPTGSGVKKWNGSSWTQLTSPNINSINKIIIDNSQNLYIMGYSFNGSGKYSVIKWNGFSWTELQDNNNITYNSFLPIYDITTDKLGNVYAAGSFATTHYVSKWNGNNWTKFAYDSTFPFSWITKTNFDSYGNFVAIGKGSTGTRIAKYDGNSWGVIATDSIVSPANVLAINSNSDIYVAGGFINTNGKYYVAVYK